MPLWLGITMIIVLYVLSSIYFYYLGARNEARWWAKKLRGAEANKK